MPKIYTKQNFQILPKTKLSSLQCTVPPPCLLNFSLIYIHAHLFWLIIWTACLKASSYFMSPPWSKIAATVICLGMFCPPTKVMAMVARVANIAIPTLILRLVRFPIFTRSKSELKMNHFKIFSAPRCCGSCRPTEPLQRTNFSPDCVEPYSRLYTAAQYTVYTETILLIYCSMIEVFTSFFAEPYFSIYTMQFILQYDF